MSNFSYGFEIGQKISNIISITMQGIIFHIINFISICLYLQKLLPRSMKPTPKNQGMLNQNILKIYRV